MSLGDTLSEAVSNLQRDLVFMERKGNGGYRNRVEALVEVMTMLQLAYDIPSSESEELKNWFLDAFDAAVDLNKVTGDSKIRNFRGKTARQILSEEIKEGRKQAREYKRKFDEEYEAWNQTVMAN